MIGFETATGSTYELDTDAKRIRRLSGTKDPQPRQGTDGVWKPYEDISAVRMGENVTVVWPATTPVHADSPACAKPATTAIRKALK